MGHARDPTKPLASLKYFILSALASGMYLYGVSFGIWGSWVYQYSVIQNAF